MKRCRIIQPVAALPAAIVGSWNLTGRRVRLVVLPRLNQGGAFYQGRKAWIRYDLDGSRHELEPSQGRAQLAELLEGVKAESAHTAPEVLRGRWACSTTIKNNTLIIKLSRAIGYVSAALHFEAGGWKVMPFKRRPAWFSETDDWSQAPIPVPSLIVGLTRALEEARAGITLACTRRDTTRREPPAPPGASKKRKRKQGSKPQPTQKQLF